MQTYRPTVMLECRALPTQPTWPVPLISHGEQTLARRQKRSFVTVQAGHAKVVASRVATLMPRASARASTWSTQLLGCVLHPSIPSRPEEQAARIGCTTQAAAPALPSRPARDIASTATERRADWCRLVDNPRCLMRRHPPARLTRHRGVAAGISAEPSISAMPAKGGRYSRYAACISCRGGQAFCVCAAAGFLHVDM